MSHRLMDALLVTIVLGAAGPRTAAAQTPGDSVEKPAVIRLALDRDRYADGDWAAALVMTREDGYVIVIQVDPDRVAHVIFPASPGGDAFIRAGDLSVRGAHGRYSFEVKGSPGSGLVYAAYSTVPFQFAAFTRHGRWAIGSEDSILLASDPEHALAQIVERMSSGPFSDDLVQYDVLGADAVADMGADTQLMAATDFAFADCGIGDACAAPGGGVYVCGGCGDAGTPGAPPPAPPPSSTPPVNLGGPATAPRVHYPDPPRVDPAPPSAATPAPASPRPSPPPLIRPFVPPSPPPTQPPPATPQPGPRFEPPHVDLHPAPPPPPPPAPPPAPPPSPPPSLAKPPL